jgi:hypothetical protein
VAAILRNSKPSFAERVVIAKSSFLRLYLYLLLRLIEGLQYAAMSAEACLGQLGLFWCTSGKRRMISRGPSDRI